MSDFHLICPHAPFGDLSAAAEANEWRAVLPVELREAVTGATPAQRTFLRAGWSDEEWRILFECEDADPWATLTQRDAPLYKEETVEVFFDPVGDLAAYYEVEVNPLGAILDIVFRKIRSGYRGDWAWDCPGLRTKVALTSSGWTAELAIPFASVAAKPEIGSCWRANFCRIDRPSRDGSVPRELSAWSPPLRESFHTPERFGIVEFGS